MQEMQEMWVWTLGQKNLLEKEMATLTSILVRKISWTKEPGELIVRGVTKSQTQLRTFPEGQHIYSSTPRELIVCFLLFGVCVCVHVCLCLCVYVCVCVCTSVSLFRFWFLQVFAEEHWYLVSLFHINRDWTLIWFYFCPLMSRTKKILISFEIKFLA